MFGLFKRKQETEKRAEGYTDIALATRQQWVTGQTGIADLTATVQGSVSLWENGLSVAKASNDLLTPETLALTARSLALYGEALFIIDDDDLIPASAFDLTTRGGKPRAYRVTVPEAGGGYSTNLLAGEVLHFRIGCDPAAPWRGTSPLRRASLSANALHAVESALSDVYANAPMASQVMPMPENTTAERDKFEASFRGQRGRVLLPESTTVTAAGGPQPASDWKPSDLTPNMRDSMAVETWRDARHSIMHVYGVLPALLNNQATGPLVREAQRHLAQWVLSPIATSMAAEVKRKTRQDCDIDVSSPLHAFDAGGRARAMSGIVQALALAKESGIDADQVKAAAAWAGVDADA